MLPPLSANRRTAGTADEDEAGRSFWPRARVRRPLDFARLLAIVAFLVAIVAVAGADVEFLRTSKHWIPAVRSGWPRTLLSFGNVAASVAVFGSLVAVVVDAFRLRRLALTSAAIACVTAAGMSYGLAALVGGDARSILLGIPGVSDGLSITVVVALMVGADLHRRRWFGAVRLSTAAAVALELGLGSLTVSSASYAVVVGGAAGLAARVAVGVVPARPSDEIIRSVLARAGFEVIDMVPVQQAAGRVRYSGVEREIGDVRITVVDPDRGGVPLVRRLWRLVRLRTRVVGRPALTLRGQLERQALVGGLAASSGAAAPEVLALLSAGRALLLIERTLVGMPYSEIDVLGSDGAVPAAFATLRRLHQAGLAHGAIAVSGLVLLPDGAAGFADLSAAQAATTELQRGLDIAALLVVIGTLVGAPASVEALRATYTLSPANEARLAALLQPVVLPASLRRTVRHSPILGELRAAIAGTGTPSVMVGVPRLERLKPRTVVSVVGATLAVYLLSTQLSQVSIGSAIRSADPFWLAVAVLGSAITYLGAAVALTAFVSTKLRLGRTTLVQVAASFVALVTPPAVGHVGLNIRYLQKSGLPTATAAADVAVKEVVTVVVTIPLLLICGWLSGVSGSRLALLPSGTVLAITGGALAVLAIVAFVQPTRRLLRRRLEPLIRRTLPQLISTLSDPRRLGTAVLGVLLLNSGYVLALDASLRAFSTSLALPTLVVVYLAASTIGSAAPTPGGLGAVEAALVGGLTATGIPVAPAITAVLAFRAATFWLPAPFGWAAFVLLQRRDRI
ncbi:uncharacterized protein (TIRG00374 family) [Nakamurella sp. UYEF19]|uniref:lysylphosphatidylglycerol synthase transmembrane domain-containing protein n=1 Tax=Nakamurella sp. UYEF19 TaxID=1756392 RepID=UPI00339126D1